MQQEDPISDSPQQDGEECIPQESAWLEQMTKQTCMRGMQILFGTRDYFGTLNKCMYMDQGIDDTDFLIAKQQMAATGFEIAARIFSYL